jgi:hypothetical protein
LFKISVDCRAFKTRNNMNIQKIKEIVNSSLPENVMSNYILSIIADDKRAIPYILEIIQHERELKQELILDTNAELSRALLVLNDKNLKWNKKVVTDPSWVVEQIKLHYEKWKGIISCNFKTS